MNFRSDTVLIQWHTEVMKPMFFRVLLLLMASSLVTGCGLWSRGTPGESPMPLPEIIPQGTPEILWSRSIGAGGNRYLWKMRPAVIEDRVLVADVNGQLTAVNRDNGSTVWSRRVENATVTTGIAAAEGVAVFGTLEGQAIAVSVQDGGELWRVDLSSEAIALSPISDNLTVLRTNDGRLHALEADSGSFRWATIRETPALSLRGGHTPKMLPGRVLTGFDNGQLALFGAARGNVLWETSIALPSGRSELERLVDVDGYLPIFRGVVVATSYQGQLAALTLDDGQILWTRPFSSHQGADIHGTSMTVVAADADSQLWRFDLRNGDDFWMQRALRLRGITAPVIVEDLLIVGDYEGYLHWLAIEDGTFLAQIRVGNRAIINRPELVDGILYVLSENGQLSAVRGVLGAMQ